MYHRVVKVTCNTLSQRLTKKKAYVNINIYFQLRHLLLALDVLQFSKVGCFPSSLSGSKSYFLYTCHKQTVAEGERVKNHFVSDELTTALIEFL